jgi:hypothetical protein
MSDVTTATLYHTLADRQLQTKQNKTANCSNMELSAICPRTDFKGTQALHKA